MAISCNTLLVFTDIGKAFVLVYYAKSLYFRLNAGYITLLMKQTDTRVREEKSNFSFTKIIENKKLRDIASVEDKQCGELSERR